jgi:hypothetical protein
VFDYERSSYFVPAEVTVAAQVPSDSSDKLEEAAAMLNVDIGVLKVICSNGANTMEEIVHCYLEQFHRYQAEAAAAAAVYPAEQAEIDEAIAASLEDPRDSLTPEVKTELTEYERTIMEALKKKIVQSPSAAKEFETAWLEVIKSYKKLMKRLLKGSEVLEMENFENELREQGTIPREHLLKLEELLDEMYYYLNKNNMSAEEKIIIAEIEGMFKKPEIVEMVDRAEAVAMVAAAERAEAAAAAAEQAASVA